MLVGDQPSPQVLDANAPRQLHQEEQGWVLMQHFSPLGGFIEGVRPAPHQLHSLLASRAAVAVLLWLEAGMVLVVRGTHAACHSARCLEKKQHVP